MNENTITSDPLDQTVCILSFSSRKDGNCARISKKIDSLLPKTKIYRFSDFKLQPCGNCSYECFQSRETCPWMKDMECEILDAVVTSRLTYFVIPNYGDYPCANFFIFNERSQCYFQNRPKLWKIYEQVPKKFIVVSNTNRENFITALADHTTGTPDILFLSAKNYGKISLAGDLMDSEEAVAELQRFVLRA